MKPLWYNLFSLGLCMFYARCIQQFLWPSHRIKMAGKRYAMMPMMFHKQAHLRIHHSHSHVRFSDRRYEKERRARAKKKGKWNIWRKMWYAIVIFIVFIILILISFYSNFLLFSTVLLAAFFSIARVPYILYDMHFKRLTHSRMLLVNELYLRRNGTTKQREREKETIRFYLFDSLLQFSFWQFSSSPFFGLCSIELLFLFACVKDEGDKAMAHRKKNVIEELWLNEKVFNLTCQRKKWEQKRQKNNHRKHRKIISLSTCSFCFVRREFRFAFFFGFSNE